MAFQKQLQEQFLDAKPGTVIDIPPGTHPLDRVLTLRANGAYGIYPVKSRNILIEASSSWGASDAGIYVGQSNNVIVHCCHAEQNVAGIENTINADVYENVATGTNLSGQPVGQPL